MQQYWTGFFFVASVIFLLYWITTAFIFLTAYSSAYWSLLTAVWIFILFASSFYQNRATNPSTYSLVNDFSELEGIAPLKPKISSYFYFLFALFGAVCSLLAAGFFIPSSDFRSVIFAAISSIFAGALAVVIFRSKISKLSPKKEKEQNKYCLHTTLIFLALFFSFLVLFSTIQAIMGSLTLYPAQGTSFVLFFGCFLFSSQFSFILLVFPLFCVLIYYFFVCSSFRLFVSFSSKSSPLFCLFVSVLCFFRFHFVFLFLET